MTFATANGLRKETVRLLLEELEALQRKYNIEVADYNRLRALLKSRLIMIENEWIRFAIANFQKPWKRRVNREGERVETHLRV